MVKNTCVCTTSEAMPGEMSARMAWNNSPNWPTPSSRPTATRCRHGTAGRLRKNRKGKAENKNRRLASRNGGSSASPHLMTTKLVPQTHTMARMSSRCVRGMGRARGRGEDLKRGRPGKD
jgi:hypothetical protein